ncbi:unnamed protein product [Ixodes persulcatus]
MCGQRSIVQMPYDVTCKACILFALIINAKSNPTFYFG